MFQLFHVISQAYHQNLKAVRQRRLCYQRKLRSGGHKGNRKTSRCGPQKPKERDGVSLLHVVESFSKMRTESISDFMEHVPTEGPNHLPAPCLHPTDEHCQEKSSDGFIINHPQYFLETLPVFPKKLALPAATVFISHLSCCPNLSLFLPPLQRKSTATGLVSPHFPHHLIHQPSWTCTILSFFPPMELSLHP